MSSTRDRPVVLVLGATGGIGSALSRRLAAAGVELHLAARKRTELEELGGETGASLSPVEDLTDFDQVDRVVRAALEARGRIDGAVNCVGSVFLRPAHRVNAEQFLQVLQTNLGSAFALVRSVSSPMMTSGGSIVLLGSAASEVGLGSHEAIAAAKAGIGGLVRSAAASYARWGIRVNAVAPGLTRTRATKTLTASEVTERASISMHPLGRLGEPADISSAIEWLLRAENDWITGQVIAVDGGLSRVRDAAKA